MLKTLVQKAFSILNLDHFSSLETLQSSSSTFCAPVRELNKPKVASFDVNFVI